MGKLEWVTNAHEDDVPRQYWIRLTAIVQSRLSENTGTFQNREWKKTIRDNIDSGKWRIGRPKATEAHTVEQLISFGMLGIYDSSIQA